MINILSQTLIILCVQFGSVALAEAPKQLEIKKLKISHKTVQAEIAVSANDQARGLMFRKKLCDDCGMLFVYTDEQTRSFWMKNTFIPLSIGFFNKNKELVDIQEMAPVVSEMQTDIPTYESRQPAMFVLEMNKGWFQKNNIRLKTKFKFE